MRFSSSDESVFTVGRTKGKVTAVGAGEAVLTVWAVQSEEAVYDEDGEIAEYRATTEPRPVFSRMKINFIRNLFCPKSDNRHYNIPLPDCQDKK